MYRTMHMAYILPAVIVKNRKITKPWAALYILGKPRTGWQKMATAIQVEPLFM